MMAFPPNYRHERANRDRNKEAKKQEKLKKREEASAQRKALREPNADDEGPAVNSEPGKS
jgi:hypothetical protein